VGLPRPSEGGSVRILESCSYTWIFDGVTHKFRRIPRDATVSLELPAPWAPYRRLDVDEERACFTVELGDAMRIRAWLHGEPCPRCGRSDPSPGRERWGGPWWRAPAPVREPRR
jgi:hypothetical protein